MMNGVNTATPANSYATTKSAENSADKTANNDDVKSFGEQSKGSLLRDEKLLTLLIQLIEQMLKLLTGGSSDGKQAGGSDGKQAGGSDGKQAGGSDGKSTAGSERKRPSGADGKSADGADGAGQNKQRGGSVPNGGNDTGISSVEGKGPGGSAGDGRIPKPTEHIQNLNLGGKNVTVGGDGSASKAEVDSTANQIQHLYDNSPTFRNMIDSSSDPAFEVSVGRRSDNISWGNTEGRVFMNINNVRPDYNNSFQALLGHEFAHASIDLPHGAEIERIERAIAQEA